MLRSTTAAPKGRAGVFWAAAVIIFVNTVIAVFSIVREALVVERGWQPVEVNLAMSLYLLSLAVSGILSGWAVDRIGPRRLVYLGAVLFGGGWFLAGSAATVGELYLWLGVIAGLGCGASYNPVITTVLRWFPDRHGLVSGGLLAAGAIGPAVLSAGLGLVIAGHGVGVGLQCLGVVLFVVTAAPGWFVRAPGAGASVARVPQDAAHADPLGVAAGPVEPRPRSPFRSARFWMLFTVFAIVTTPGNMIVSSLASITRQQVGGEDPAAAAALATLMVTLLPLANFLGRLLFGVVYDRWGGYPALWLCLGLTVLALLGLIGARELALFLPAVLLLGVAFGSTLVIFPPLTGREFGMDGLPFVYGVMFLGYAVGGFLGPWAAGALAVGADPAAYAPAYAVSLGLCVLGALIVLLLDRRPPPRSGDAVAS